MENKKISNNWFEEGYEHGCMFARDEADYDELAAICRAGDIPKNWDIFRAEIIFKFLGETGFDFQDYAAGFTRACREFFETI